MDTLEDESRKKIALFSNLREERVFSIPDVSSIYTIPKILKEQKIDRITHGLLGVPFEESAKGELWETILAKPQNKEIQIGII